MPQSAGRTGRGRLYVAVGMIIVVLIVSGVLLLRPRRSDQASCETAAVGVLFASAVAQAAFSLYQEHGSPRFAERFRDLYYHEVDGRPVALIPRALADADSPRRAVKGYYYTMIPEGPDGMFDPALDFAICATPVHNDCRVFFMRGTRGTVWYQHGQQPRNPAPLKKYPAMENRHDLVPIGFTGYVRIEKAGVAYQGDTFFDSMHGDKESALTLEELERICRERLRSAP